MRGIRENLMKNAIYLGKVEEWATDARLYRLIDPPFYAGKRKRVYIFVSGGNLCETIGLPEENFDGYHIDRYERTYSVRRAKADI